MTVLTKFVQTPIVSLYSGMGAADTTCVITPYPLDLDGVKLTMSDFGAVGNFTVDPKISGFEEINSFSGITDNGNNTATLTGLTRNLLGKYPYTASSAGGKLHGSSAVVVFSDNPQMYAALAAKANDETITGQWTFNNTPIVPGTVSNASTTVKGVSKVSVAPVDPNNPIVVGQNDTTAFAPYGVCPPGTIEETVSRTAPSTYLFTDGSAVSRTGATANLFAAIAPSGTFTVTIASPAVFTKTAHGLLANDRVSFTTTGGLPSGLAVNTDYYVISTGLTSNTFQVSIGPGGTTVNTTVSQSGIHTVYLTNFGKGDGSTTFNVPLLNSSFGSAVAISSADFGSANTNKYLGYTGGNLGISAASSVTVSLWVKLNTEITTGSYGFINLGDTGTQFDQFIWYQWNSGPAIKLSVTRSRNGGTQDVIQYTQALGTSLWHNIVYTYDGTTMILYLDGVLVASGASGTGSGSSGTTQGVFIGSERHDIIYASAKICSVKIFSGLIWTSANVLAEYNNPTTLTGTESGLAAYYAFTQTTLLNDLSPHGYTLTNNNSVAASTDTPNISQLVGGNTKYKIIKL